MDTYVTGSMIKTLREARKLTQNELGDQIGVSGKAVSKWETGRGFPDVSLLEPLSLALHVSVFELLSGSSVKNNNVSANILRSKFYVCPVCGNIIHAFGETLVSCCGLTLPCLEAEEMDEAHQVQFEKVEDETFVSISHEMSKTHYISFLAYVTFDRFLMVKLYPEGEAQARFPLRKGAGFLFLYCNRHGLMKRKI